MALGSTEAEGVGQFLTQRRPEFRLLGIVERQQAVIESFQFLVVLGDIWIGSIGIATGFSTITAFMVAAFAIATLAAALA